MSTWSPSRTPAASWAFRQTGSASRRDVDVDVNGATVQQKCMLAFRSRTAVKGIKRWGKCSTGQCNCVSERALRHLRGLLLYDRNRLQTQNSMKGSGRSGKGPRKCSGRSGKGSANTSNKFGAPIAAANALSPPPPPACMTTVRGSETNGDRAGKQ